MLLFSTCYNVICDLFSLSCMHMISHFEYHFFAAVHTGRHTFFFRHDNFESCFCIYPYQKLIFPSKYVKNFFLRLHFHTYAEFSLSGMAYLPPYIHTCATLFLSGMTGLSFRPIPKVYFSLRVWIFPKTHLQVTIPDGFF